VGNGPDAEAGGGEKRLSDKVSMCNYYANRLCCEAADRAMQVHGGIGYSRHKPFEHIYRHHRRYRITEGSEEIQIRKVAGHLFGYHGPEQAWPAKRRKGRGRQERGADGFCGSLVRDKQAKAGQGAAPCPAFLI
jgi:hypothetical protein